MCLNELICGVLHGNVMSRRCGFCVGPEGCTEEFVGGLPVYQGLELDVLRSLVVHFSLQTEPLISCCLGDLFAAILREFVVLEWLC